MERIRRRRSVASGLATLFTVLWWWILIGSILVAVVVLTSRTSVGVQIGPDGQPDFVAGRAAQIVLPVAFELDAGTANVRSSDGRHDGVIEHANGLLRVTTPDRPWMAMTAGAVALALLLWILAELAALCRSVRDGQPFEPGNAGRIRRLALALILAEASRAAIVYGAHAYAAAHFTADRLRFTASPHVNAVVIVGALILLVLAEAFRTGTRLDEDQSLTV